MRVDALRLKAAASAALCAAALSLAVFSQGCARGSSVSPPRALIGGSTPTQNTGPAPAPSPAVESPLPPPKGFVNDFANVIDDQTEKLLEAKFERLKKSARIEFAVVTVETTGEQDIFDYSLAVARGWGIGPPAGEEGGGVLLLLAIKDRKWRIHVSRSLETDLPDNVAGEIGREMTLSLRAERYDEAITKCVDGLIERLAERRGFSTKDGELNIQTSPAASPRATPRTTP